MTESVLRMATDMISVFRTPVSSVMRDVEGIAGCRSKSDASFIFGSRRAAEVVNSQIVVLGRGARPEGVTLKYTILPLPLATPADTWHTSAGKFSMQGLLLLLKWQ